MIEDFKDDSNPIVDTDYRFGFMTKFQCFCLDTMKLGVRFVPWAHESTHLGDEYTIFAQQNPSFERINVSHEDWEYGVSLEGGGLPTAVHHLDGAEQANHQLPRSLDERLSSEWPLGRWR